LLIGISLKQNVENFMAYFPLVALNTLKYGVTVPVQQSELIDLIDKAKKNRPTRRLSGRRETHRPTPLRFIFSFMGRK
jgi:hypothetical protein